MDPRRLAYLEALGVTAYERRSPVQGGGPAAHAGPSADAAPDAEGDPAASMDWQTLESAVLGCERCDLCRTRTQAVFGVGSRHAALMVVGEAPGAEEDRQGEPFVGRAGQLLNSMLRAIGLARGDVFIANVLKCRPPGNRDPKPEEVARCLPYLQRQIELVSPRVILCVGRIAAHNLLGTDQPLGRLRGGTHGLPGGTPVVVTYHPAYLLRSPEQKAKAWQDLRTASRMLGDGDRH